jgi:hypothetical protein
VEGVHARIEEACQRLPAGLDVAVSAFAFHHLPREAKLVAASRLARAVDHLVLMEVEGNHDLPELHAPELSVSLYQVYGGGAEFVLSAGAAPEASEVSVERFLFAEVVSMLTQPRGVRSEYHMLRGQWMGVLEEGLGAAFQLRADDTLHSDGRVEMFMLHLGKG